MGFIRNKLGFQAKSVNLTKVKRRTYMSFIKNECKCKYCNSINKYYWLFPDSKFEQIPNEEYTQAESNNFGDHYVISVKCNNCNKIIMVNYSLDGKEIKGK